MLPRNAKLLTVLTLIALLASSFAGVLTFVTESATADPIVPDEAVVEQDHSKTIAVLIRASYYQYGMTYPYKLYYNAALATLQTLQYLGIPAEIVTDAISQSDLNEYGGLITVRGEGQCWALTKAYSETTGNPVLWLYVRGGDGAMNTALGITDGGQIYASDIGAGTGAVVATSAAITDGLSDTWGMLPSFTARSFTFSGLSTVTNYIINANDASQPYLFGAQQNGGTYYVYATANAWLAGGATGQYYTQLILNYAGEAITDLVRWMPVPSAKDSALIIRADDAVGLDSKWLAFWERYPHSTSAVQASLDQTTADFIKANVDDYLPHGFAHDDFSVLTYAEQVALLEQVNAAWEARFGERPYYYIMPYNKANEDTAKAMDTTGGQFYITATGLTGLPSTYYYRHHDNQAVTWGAYYEGGTLADYVDMIVGQERFVGSITLHPYTQDWSTIQTQGDYIIDRVLADGTTMLSTWSEIAELYYVRQHVVMNATHIQFGVDTPAGLTLEWNGLTAGNTLRVGDVVLPRIGDRMVLPAMDAGVYSISEVAINAYPVVTSVGAGLALKDGSYSIDGACTSIEVEGWGYDGTPSAVVTLSTLTGKRVIDASSTEITPTGTTVTLTPGSYDVIGLSYVWDGGGADALASNPLNWDRDAVPSTGDLVMFDATSVKSCTWDLAYPAFVAYSLTLATGYTGTVTQGDVDMGIGAGGFLKESGTIVGNWKWIICNGPWNSIGGSDTPYSISLKFTGNSTFTEVRATGYNSIWNTGQMTMGSKTNSNFGAYSVINDGTIITDSNKIRVMFNHVSSKFDNRGVITGNYKLDLFTRGYDATISLVGVDCPVAIFTPTNAYGNRVVTINEGGPIRSLNVYSDHTTYTCTLDLAGHSLTAASVTVGTGGNILWGEGTHRIGSLDTSAGGSDFETSQVIMEQNGTVKTAAGQALHDLTVEEGVTTTLQSDVDVTHYMFPYGNIEQGSYALTAAKTLTDEDILVWDGSGADSMASSAANWRHYVHGIRYDDVGPYQGANILYDFTSTKDSTWDLTTEVGSILIETGYSGNIAQSSHIYIGAGGFVQHGGTFTPYNQRTIYNYGPFIRTGGSFGFNTAHLIMLGEGQTIATLSGTTFYSLRIEGNTSANTCVASHIAISEGVTLTLNKGHGIIYRDYGGSFSNMGTIAGPGSIVFSLYNGNPAEAFGNITAPLHVESRADTTGDRTLTIDGYSNIQSITIASLHPTYTTTLDLNGHYLHADDVVVGARGAITGFILTTPPSGNVTHHSDYMYKVEAWKSSISLVEKPMWLNWNRYTNTFTGPAIQAGQFDVTIRATSPYGTEYQTWTITVPAAQSDPAWTAGTPDTDYGSIMLYVIVGAAIAFILLVFAFMRRR